MNKRIGNLLGKEMDRKGFLQFSGAAALMFLGGGTIIKSLANMKFGEGEKSVKKTNSGYGASAYGGSTGSSRIRLCNCESCRS